MIKKKFSIIIQARMGSSRLPGKVLFKHKNLSNKGPNQKSASHELLIQLWRIQKKLQLLC
jgi:hypothetical protein